MRYGLDTVGVSFPICEADLTGATITTTGAGTEKESHTYRRALEGGGFMAWGIGGTAWVEASLPKRAGPNNVSALGVADSVEVLREMYREALGFCVARPEVGAVADLTGGGLESGSARSSMPGAAVFDLVKIKRLDIVRDFDGVTAIPALLDGLASVRRAGRSKVRRFADGEANLAETLRVGPKSWACTLYDKFAETGGACAPGRLRFEARCRSELLEGERLAAVTAPVRRVSDLSDAGIALIASAQWEHVGFGAEVNGVGSFAARINACDLSPVEKRNLVGYLAARSLGVELEMSPNTERKYRRAAAALGLVIVDGDVSFRARLDLAEGIEILEAD